MRFQTFTVRDTKANVFLPPFFTNTVATALRMIRQRMDMEPESDWAKYPSDFALYSIGHFNTETAEWTDSGLQMHMTLDQVQDVIGGR